MRLLAWVDRRVSRVYTVCTSAGERAAPKLTLRQNERRTRASLVLTYRLGAATESGPVPVRYRLDMKGPLGSNDDPRGP